MTDMQNTQALLNGFKSMDERFNQLSGASTGFEALLGSRPYTLGDADFAAAQQRYEVIKDFQTSAMHLFRASLNGEADPIIAQGILSDVPESFGWGFHKNLPDSVWKTPVYFRTDEARLGQLTEVQCSGSGWDLVETLRDLYAASPAHYGAPKRFARSLAEEFQSSLQDYIGSDPVVHHLADNASRPHGARFFIQRVREKGGRFFSYDEARHSDCNFIRSHDCFSLYHHNFFADRLERSEKGECFFDLPPIALYDTKHVMAWPFWSRTREHFSDEVRALFPHTALIEADGVELEDGVKVGIQKVAEIENNQRNYFVKYAGTDVARNWGSRAVFSLRRLARGKCQELLDTITEEVKKGQPWVLQASVHQKEEVTFWEPGTDEEGSMQGNGKWSCFYGPGGLKAMLVMHLGSHKVHGSDKTVMSLVY
ncbi:MAG TPA: hypothetical protein DCX06_10360 [Opitutae bacterium]|nr:hypothetical protein [Opitutae bacterium]